MKIPNNLKKGELISEKHELFWKIRENFMKSLVCLLSEIEEHIACLKLEEKSETRKKK